MEKDWDVFIHFLQKLIENPAVKIIAGIFIGLIRLLFGSVFRPAYGAVFALWLFDTATGYYHARSNPEIIPESRKMRAGLTKLLIYYGLMLLGYQIAQCGYDAAVMIQTVIELAIQITEGKSCLENLRKIGTLKKWPEGIMALINQLLKVFEGKYNEAINVGAIEPPVRRGGVKHE